MMVFSRHYVQSDFLYMPTIKLHDFSEHKNPAGNINCYKILAPAFFFY